MFATKKHIAGSEGTHNYVVICQTSLGLVEKAYSLTTHS